MSHDKVKVLLVEDHPLISRLTAELLTELGCQLVGPAHSVSEALATVEREVPDFAFIDMGLPDGDGASLFPVFTKLGIKCVALSASEIEKNDFCVATVVKPLLPEQARQLLNLP